MRTSTAVSTRRPQKFDLEPGELVCSLSRPVWKDESDGRKKPKMRTLKVVKKYPHMVLCKDFYGHLECFSEGDYYSETLIRYR